MSEIDEKYFLAGTAAQLIKLDYVAALKIFTKDNVLLEDHKGRAVVPASYLTRHPGYRAYIRSLPQNAWGRGILFQPAAPKAPVPASTRDIASLLPLKFMHDDYVRTFTYMGGTQDTLDQQAARLPLGRIRNKAELMAILAQGRIRTLGKGANLRYYLSDLMDPASWASPAEKSWRAGAELLRRLYEERTGKAVAGAPVKFPLLELDEEQELKPPERRGRPRKSGETGRLPEEAVILASPTTSIPSNGQAFSWEAGELALPPPNQRDYYLQAIPADTIAKAAEVAHNWAEVLLEERTGYIEATDPTWADRAWFLYPEWEKLVYSNRNAFKGGCLQPLLPAGFNFIF